MTPATYSLLSLLDRWRTMLGQLAGEPAPLLPALPGRRCRPLPDSDADPYAARWDAAHALPPDGEGNTPD